MQSQNEKLTYNVVEVSRILGISRGSAFKGVMTGEIPHIRVGKRILIPVASLTRLLESADNGQKGTDDG